MEIHQRTVAAIFCWNTQIWAVTRGKFQGISQKHSTRSRETPWNQRAGMTLVSHRDVFCYTTKTLRKRSRNVTESDASAVLGDDQRLTSHSHGVQCEEKNNQYLQKISLDQKSTGMLFFLFVRVLPNSICQSSLMPLSYHLSSVECLCTHVVFVIQCAKLNKKKKKQ